jgi:ubiquinone/menaquinone biosynthesis C-methylase UbiE
MKINTGAAAEFLRRLVEKEFREDFGVYDSAQVELIVAAWMDDEKDAAWRFAELEASSPGAKRILDMACGCGTAVFWGLIHGLDMYGIDPNPDKHRFMALKSKEYGYPEAWLSRFHIGVGENLPYKCDEFDAVLSYQTMEHVQNPRQVMAELIRVTRVGGCINLRFPDYRGTYEAHYQLPWLPLLPKAVAKLYLSLLGRPWHGLQNIQYVTGPRVKKLLQSLQQESPSWRLEIHNGSKNRFLKAMAAKGLPNWSVLYGPYYVLRYFRILFRSDLEVNYFIRIIAK